MGLRALAPDPFPDTVGPIKPPPFLSLENNINLQGTMLRSLINFAYTATKRCSKRRGRKC